MGLWFYEVSASAPLTVLVGAVVATYAATGVVGLPLSFLVLALALAALAVGYVAMSRYVRHAATFYALVSQGLGRAWGLASGVVALVGYNAIQISLYGLLGATVAEQVGGPWWLWAAVVCAMIAGAGVLRVSVGAGVLAVFLVAEISVIVLFDIAAFTNPAGGEVSTAPLEPRRLVVDGLGGVLAFGIASFVGFECGAAYSEEVRTDRTVGRATFVALAVLGLLYFFSSWALGVAVGPDQVAAKAGGDAVLPLTVLSETFGPLVGRLGGILFVTSIFATMLSFHATIARYVFGLARERVLPPVLARTGTGTRSTVRDAPIGGSLVQTALAAAVVAGFAVSGADPVTTLFTWFATAAAIAVLVLLLAASAAALRWFHHGGGTTEGAWSRVVAPIIGIGAGLVVLGATVINLDTLLQAPPWSPQTVIIPGSVGAATIVGLVWAAVLRRRRPDVYQAIGHGRPDPLSVPDRRLAELRF